ncbi:MAG: 2Fe-2S iron-sulfur cluster-binding protein [Candidatus Bathyarchaeota archaeon]|jgi:NADH dehydrogenase/NADH:ubiquinone oxidoreductase subunit G
MVTLTIDGVEVQAQEGSTLLEVARFYGFNIPTLCHHDELTPYGACRLCMVEVNDGRRTRLVVSCLYPVKEGIIVRTNTERILKGRKLLLELMIAKCPNSKTLQDLASKMGLEQVRFKMEDKDCILCGLCVRICKEQMGGGAIGFVGRGQKREVITPFRQVSDVCRNCGACMYICPIVEVQCRGVKSPGELCNSCLVFTPQCLEEYDQVMCTLDSCGSCVKKEEK